MASYEDRISFIAEWYQVEAALRHKYLMKFFPFDKSLNIVEISTNKMFLRRSKMEDITEKDFFVGSKISIYGRQFDLIDYGDEATREALSRTREKTVLVLKNTMWTKCLGELLLVLIDNQINISNAIMLTFTHKLVTQYLDLKKQDDIQASALMNELTAAPVICLELIGCKVLELMVYLHQTKSADNPIKKPEKVTHLLEEFFNRIDVAHGFLVSKNHNDAATDINFFFATYRKTPKSCKYGNSTLAIIKPHAIKEGSLGKIINDIFLQGFQITALRMTHMIRCNCEELYSVYRGLLPEYIDMVMQLASGPCICMEIRCADPEKSSHLEFRNYCGPMDPNLARTLRPNTLRAKYGVNSVTNALHCTDLVNDTKLELFYMFETLD